MAPILDLCKCRKLPKVVVRTTELNLFHDPMGVKIHKNVYSPFSKVQPQTSRLH